jgi:hypothetical protein
MSDIIQFNKFCDLHDGKNIIFCKTDFLAPEFEFIKTLENDVILISGNSDYAITDEIAALLPENVLKWYCHNNLSSHPKTVSIPMGIENSVKAVRNGHGVGWDHAIEKEKTISYLFEDDDSTAPSKFIYANFNINTNPQWRTPTKEMCQYSDLINWDQSKLDYFSFISKILDHEAVVCPIGNGPDTHRLYETLYLGRIPIVFSFNEQAILYKSIYSLLPVVLLDNLEDLNNENLLRAKLDDVASKNLDMAKYSYWEERILDI